MQIANLRAPIYLRKEKGYMGYFIPNQRTSPRFNKNNEAGRTGR
jgi:hypothetical protein